MLLAAGSNHSSPGGKDISMKRVLTLATCGLFATGLAVLPMAARADQTVTGTTVPAPAASTTAPAKMSGEHSAAVTVKKDEGTVKKDDKKVTAAPTTAAPSTSTTTTTPNAVKTAGKGAS
jgi:hypothetical protein